MKTILSLTLICVLIALVALMLLHNPKRTSLKKRKQRKKELQKAEQKAKPEAGKKLDENKAAKTKKLRRIKKEPVPSGQYEAR